MDEALNLPCQELVEQLTDYLEDALPPDRMRLLRDHLDLCQGCSAHLEQLRRAVELIERAPPSEPPSAEHSKRVEELFREWATQR